jgi:F-type H+-transporting ATPase subunit b
MSFDWFTFAAQMVNFLLLIYLLRRFLYGPIISYMDERQANINAQIEDAKTREQNAEQTLGSVQGEKNRLLAERESLLAQARAEAETAKQALLKEARAQVDVQRQQWQTALAKEKEAFIEAMQKRATTELYKSMRRVLADLADAPLEQHIIKVFIKRLSTLAVAEQEAMQRALARNKHQAQLVTAFPLTAAQKLELEQALSQVLGQDMNLQLEQHEDLVCGIELNVFDQRLAWTLVSYLDSLEKEMNHQFSPQGVKDKPVEAKPDAQGKLKVGLA